MRDGMKEVSETEDVEKKKVILPGIKAALAALEAAEFGEVGGGVGVADRKRRSAGTTATATGRIRAGTVKIPAFRIKMSVFRRRNVPATATRSELARNEDENVINALEPIRERQGSFQEAMARAGEEMDDAKTVKSKEFKDFIGKNEGGRRQSRQNRPKKTLKRRRCNRRTRTRTRTRTQPRK